MEKYTNSTLAGIEERIESAVNTYRNDVNRLIKSEHPQYTGNEALREYEVNEMKQEFEQQIAQLSEEYKTASESLLAEYEGKALLSAHKVSELDKIQVNTLVSDFTANVTLAYGEEGRREAIREFKKAISHLTPGGMTHVRRQIPSILPLVKDDAETVKELRGLNSLLSELKTPAQVAYEGVKSQAESGGLTPYRILKASHSTYGNHKDDGLQAVSLAELAQAERERGAQVKRGERLL